MKKTIIVTVFFILVLILLPVSGGFSQEKSDDPPAVKPKVLSLATAVICEDVKDYQPRNSAIAFSISVGKISCFTLFDQVPKKSFIYHKWYHRDKLSTRKTLTIKPPRWATFSSIQLRQTDKGPLLVEITDPKGKLFKILRFSVTD